MSEEQKTKVQTTAQAVDLQTYVIRQLTEENKRFKKAIQTVLEWSKFEIHYCPKCGHGDPVKDSDYVDELKKAIAV